MDPDWVTFCCALIHRDVFEKIGLLDERFKFTGEDVDFCVRAKKAGFEIKVVENAKIYHKIPINRWERMSFKRLWFRQKCRWLFWRKWNEN